MNIVDEQKANDESISVDQDHNNITVTEENDFGLLRAKLVSLKLDLNKKEVLLNEKDCELEVAQVELADANVKALDMKREIDAKN